MPITNNRPRVYRLRGKRGNGRVAVPKTFTMSPTAIRQLGQLKELFYRRYPKDQFKNLSVILETVIQRSLTRYNDNPIELTMDVREFQQKYPRGTKPAVIQIEEKGYPRP